MLIHATLAATLLFASQAEPTENTAPATSPEAETVMIEPTPPAEEEQSAAEIEDADEEYDNERICRRVQVVGSRLKKRACATRKQWAAMAEESRNLTGDLQRRGQAPGSGVN